jgi:hypothetical protein
LPKVDEGQLDSLICIKLVCIIKRRKNLIPQVFNVGEDVKSHTQLFSVLAWSLCIIWRIHNNKVPKAFVSFFAFDNFEKLIYRNRKLEREEGEEVKKSYFRETSTIANRNADF